MLLVDFDIYSLSKAKSLIIDGGLKRDKHALSRDFGRGLIA